LDVERILTMSNTHTPSSSAATTESKTMITINPLPVPSLLLEEPLPTTVVGEAVGAVVGEGVGVVVGAAVGAVVGAGVGAAVG
jgi:hypothetical protein